jgi:phage terminase large subunit-like protein
MVSISTLSQGSSYKETSYKREQKEHNHQRMERVAVKCCPVAGSGHRELGIMVAGSHTWLRSVCLSLIYPGGHKQRACVYLHKHVLLVFLMNKHGHLTHAPVLG